MAEINPAEVSAILKQQLANFDTQANVEEVGTVLQIGDGIALVYGLENVQYGELVKFQGGIEGIVLNLAEDNVGVALLGESKKVKENSKNLEKQKKYIIEPYLVARRVNDFKIVFVPQNVKSLVINKKNYRLE